MTGNDNGTPLEIGRLAMREEGNWWVAYYALSDTMVGALKLADIHMRLVADNKERKQQFMDMMRDCVADIIEERTGKRPTWGGPTPAPERDRSGKA